MYSDHETAPPPAAMSRDERQKIREQLNRLLESHHFKNSKRYPPLLRCLVEETLEGRGEYLKERILGVRVFDRPADYDTAADPIVRVTIAELRKRIAQYYHDEEHDAEIRIELLPGRYAPEFRTRTTKRELATQTPEPMQASTETEVPQQVEVPAKTPSRRAWLSHKLLSVAGLCLFALLAVAAVPITRALRPASLSTLWSPLLSAPHSILFCLPTDVGRKDRTASASNQDTVGWWGNTARGTSTNGQTFLDFEALGENVVFSDVLAMLRISNVLAVNHHDYHAKLNVYTNLEDLRQGPTVLIGGLDNQWTMRALAPLRYHFAGSDEDRYWIADTKDPNNKQWSLDLKLQWGSVTRDYAIVSRLHNEETGQPEMIIAGIGMSGTAAAGEFVTDEGDMEELRRRIGAGFKDHDFEVVLSTDVVNGIAGTPKILAVSVW